MIMAHQSERCELEIDIEFDAVLVPSDIPVHVLFQQTTLPQKKIKFGFLTKTLKLISTPIRWLRAKVHNASQSPGTSNTEKCEQWNTCTDAITEYNSRDGSGSADSSNAVASPVNEYNMRHKRRGCFIILNHVYFQPHLGVGIRRGTNKDSSHLERTARKLGFDCIQIFNDLSGGDIVKKVSQIARSDHSDCDCFAMAVLTHGDSGNMLYAQNEKYHLDRLTLPFTAKNCPTLAGKPKLFFIQACRGDIFDDGALAPLGDTVDAVIQPEQIKDGKLTRNIPNAADFLLAFSTIPGYCSWRHQLSGSWFIQALCKCLTEFGDKLEILQIMTRVNRTVAFEYASSSQRFHNKKQIPSIESRLTHELFFRKKNEDEVVFSEMKPMLQSGTSSGRNSHKNAEGTKPKEKNFRRLSL